MVAGVGDRLRAACVDDRPAGGVLRAIAGARACELRRRIVLAHVDRDRVRAGGHEIAARVDDPHGRLGVQHGGRLRRRVRVEGEVIRRPDRDVERGAVLIREARGDGAELVVLAGLVDLAARERRVARSVGRLAETTRAAERRPCGAGPRSDRQRHGDTRDSSAVVGVDDGLLRKWNAGGDGAAGLGAERERVCGQGRHQGDDGGDERDRQADREEPALAPAAVTWGQFRLLWWIGTRWGVAVWLPIAVSPLEPYVTFHR